MYGIAAGVAIKLGQNAVEVDGNVQMIKDLEKARFDIFRSKALYEQKHGKEVDAADVQDKEDEHAFYTDKDDSEQDNDNKRRWLVI